METQTLHMRGASSSGIKNSGSSGNANARAEPTANSSSLQPLSPLARFYIYSLHGCLCEVAFTATCDWYDTRDRRLAGHSSLWSLPMYASAIFLMERLRAVLLARRWLLAMRLVAYTLFIYLWELSWGLGLRLLGACPWDYSGYRYNLAGLVTLEYALPWAVASLIAEKHVIRNTLRIRLEP
ncbi:transmembrane protein 229B [Gadus morhua]|uniref:transmembrane protein 229B n=1 Tax=Gadus morhua TaxID=8049 RepID=UPI0011B7D069|nr:transmembrane protein 229B-like [Gadus morhua]